MPRRHLLVVLIGLYLITFIAACSQPHPRQVESCDYCTIGDYCVWGLDLFYCADACASQADCEADLSCVPLIDEETQVDMRWVCMPEGFYTGEGLVIRSDCGDEGGQDCPDGLTCFNYSADPGTSYCAAECNYGSECLTDCCVISPDATYYCAPTLPFCQ